MVGKDLETLLPDKGQMLRGVIFVLCLSGCGTLSWNTTLPNEAGVRAAMLSSVDPGNTTETDVIARWGNPTQKIREGGETRFVYRDMRNPPGYLAPQFGVSAAYVVVVFQYGVATGAYSSDTEGCRSTFAPRPPGYGFYNPTTVKPVNCNAHAFRGVTDQDVFSGKAPENKL